MRRDEHEILETGVQLCPANQFNASDFPVSVPGEACAAMKFWRTRTPEEMRGIVGDRS